MLTSKYNQHKETIHNFIWRFLQMGGKHGVTFLIFILAAKLLIPYDFGIYNYVLAIVFLLIMFADFGISTATSKYVVEYNVTDKEKLKSVLFNSGIIILGLTIIISLITIFFGKLYLGDKYVYVLYLLPLIFLIPMTSLYDGIYRGLKKFKHLSIISIIVGLFSLSFVYFLIKQYGLTGALIAQNLFYFILFLALAFGYREFHFKLNKSVMKDIGKYSFIIGLAGIGYFLYTRIDIIILGHFGYIIEIGYYEIINKVFVILILPFLVFSQVIAPNITKYITLNKIDIVKKKILKFLPLFIVGGIILSLALYFILPLGIKTFLSKYYTESFMLIMTILLILLPIKLWGVFLTNGFIIPSGFVKIVTITTFIGGLLNVLFDYIFISWMGFIGVFWVTLIIHSLSIFIVTIWFNIKLKKGIKR